MSNLTLRADQNFPLTSLQVDGNFSALNLTKAELNSPLFTGTPRSTTKATILQASTISELSSTTGTTEIITSEWFQSQLGSISVAGIVPAVNATETPVVDSDGNVTGFTYQGVTLGTSDNRFAQLFVKNAKFSSNSIEIGDALLSGSAQGGVVLPSNTAIGTADNVLPENLASSVLDSNFTSAILNRSQLKLNFTADETYGQGTLSPTFLWLNSAGKVQKVKTATPFNKLFVGVSTASAVQGNSVEVILSGGPVGGFTNLVQGQEYYLDTDGSISPTSSTTNVKIGKASSGSDLFIYSTSTLDIYALSKTKVSLDSFSVGPVGSASGVGNIAYNNQTGQTTYVPPAELLDLSLTGTPTAPTASSGTNTTQVATTAFVEAATAALVNSAPEVLDTLAEIASAIGNDGSFATTINNLIVGLQSSKANLASPTFSGTVTAPTPAASSDDTTVATTAFVRSTSATLNDANLTGTPTAPTASVGLNNTQLATTAFVFRAVAQGGGASNMDGGVAQTTRNIATHHFDGGSASG